MTSLSSESSDNLTSIDGRNEISNDVEGNGGVQDGRRFYNSFQRVGKQT